MEVCIQQGQQLTTPENTITYHNANYLGNRVCIADAFSVPFILSWFLRGVKMAPRETEDNAYAKFWGDKQRALWDVMVFSGVVNYKCTV